MENHKIWKRIESETSEVTATMQREKAKLKTKNDTAITALKAQIDVQNQTLKELADTARGSSNSLQGLEIKVKKLNEQVDALSEKCLDLEGHSKCQNLRVVGVAEGKENGYAMTDFGARVVKEALNLDKAPVIYKAHRAQRRWPGDNEPARHLTTLIHSCHVYEDTMKKGLSMKDLTFHGQQFQIFRDLPSEVVKGCTAFTPTRMQWDKPGVRFGLLYPAKLQISHNGFAVLLRDPEGTHQYVKHHFGSPDED